MFPPTCHMSCDCVICVPLLKPRHPRDFTWPTSRRGALYACIIFIKLNKLAVRPRTSSKLIFASCVGYFDCAYYGFYVTSSRMWVLIEGEQIWQLWNSVSVQICGCGYVWDLIFYWLDVIILTAVCGGGINDHASLGESGKLLLVIGHKIWMGNGLQFCFCSLSPARVGGVVVNII